LAARDSIRIDRQLDIVLRSSEHWDAYFWLASVREHYERNLVKGSFSGRALALRNRRISCRAPQRYGFGLCGPKFSASARDCRHPAGGEIQRLGQVRGLSTGTNAPPRTFISPGKEPAFFSGPQAPREGAGALALSLDKRSPALKPLMDRCLSQTTIPEVKYAESADLARPGVEVGKHPADIPAYFEYALIGVTLSCPVVADAPEQAFVVKFNDIKWLNYDGHGEELTPAPAKLKPARTSGTTKTFIVTTFASANDISDEACPRLNSGPTEADYYALMPSEEAAKEKAALAGKGGPLNTP
jgi:hypothetical protein